MRTQKETRPEAGIAKGTEGDATQKKTQTGAGIVAFSEADAGAETGT